MGSPEKEQTANGSAATEPAPPSYTEATYQPSPSTSIPRQFPPTFNLYRISGWTSDKYSLGEHMNQPLYYCTWHSAFSSSPPLILHSGPDESFPPLATVEWQSFFRNFYVELPPLNPSSGAASAREEIEAVSAGFGRSYRFSIEVGPRNVREQFEWRHSHGDAVRHLNGQSSGWKLVRLAQGPPGAGTGSGNAATFVPGGYMTSDGHEVVAAWTMNSGSKVGKFHFTGTGLSGLLGERWAIMAVVTFCAFIQRIRRQGTSGQASINA
ncbi:hypothetical protein B0T10DRAFT_73238 [Thelonectria olida]|uniref:Uncharacterized protein n=1 Tax=Thelonectria olida TaxID=1576542 RepID=A0A9P8W152_9HYPO|nr:hypothetical protein B0T10DRAFT_73238 [Thelonectria olida]